MILSIPGGVVADRMDRRRLLIITQGLAMLLSLVLGLLTSTAQIRVWHIYAVTFLAGAVDIFDAPARTALIPLLVPAEQLASAYALNISWRQIATLAGPFLGGIVISAFGISTSYYVDALSFLSVIVCVCFALSRSLALSLVIVFSLGLVDAIGESLRDALVQLMTPDRMRGRVKSFDQVFMSTGTYMGHLQMGTAAIFLGVPGAMIFGGCLGSAAVLLVAKYARSKK